MEARASPKARAKGPKEAALPAEARTTLMNALRERPREKASQEKEATEALKEREEVTKAMKEPRDTARKEAGKEATGEDTR